jgi:hypothetical protein
MLAILHLLVMFVADIFKSRRRVEAENLFLRHQLNIALIASPPAASLVPEKRGLAVNRHGDIRGPICYATFKLTG